MGKQIFLFQILNAVMEYISVTTFGDIWELLFCHYKTDFFLFSF